MVHGVHVLVDRIGRPFHGWNSRLCVYAERRDAEAAALACGDDPACQTLAPITVRRGELTLAEPVVRRDGGA